MKKNLLLIFMIMFSYLSSFGQIGIMETFENGIPPEWSGSFQTTAIETCSGDSVRKNFYEFNSVGNITTPNIVGQSNATDLTLSFDYKIVDYYAATGPTAAGWGNFTIDYSTDEGATWINIGTIDDSNHVVSADCATKTYTIAGADLPTGSDFQLRFNATWTAGDYFLYYDNILATQVTTQAPNCDANLTSPADGDVDVVIDSNINWSQATGIATGYILSIGTSAGATDILDAEDLGLSTSYDPVDNFTFDQEYFVTIVPYNANGNATGCVEQSFTTVTPPSTGSLCENAIQVTEPLPYVTNDDTSLYGDDYSGSPGADGCSTTTSYLNGDDVVYEYTPTTDTSVDIILSDITSNYVGMFIYSSCADIGVGCQTGLTNSYGSDDLDIQDYVVTGGETYYILISTWATPQSTEYTLTITENTCINIEAEFDVVDICDADAGTEGFTVEANVIDLGDATDVTISDGDTANDQIASAPGIYTFGPYANGTDVTISIDNNQDSNCFVSSDTLSQFACPPPNDECSEAIEVTANSTSECTSTQPGTIAAATASPETNTCFGESNDDVWFWFEATAENHAISLLNITGSTTNLNHAVYEGSDCDNLDLLYCSDDFNSSSSAANGLTIGEIYYIRVYSATPAPDQTSAFDLCVSTLSPPITTSTTEYTVEELVLDVLVDNPCTQVTNITSSTGTDFGTTNGIGYFNQNGSSFPMEGGVLMSSGDVNDAPGPETDIQSGGGYDWPGDADLENAVPELDSGDSHNASVIEFDFVPFISEISFDFLFASEEYGTFQCNYSDSFAFLVTDEDGNTVNIAVVPGTTDPISVVTIRDEVHNDNCSSENEEYFGEYYGDTGISPITAPINFKGRTTMMTAEANVVPGQQYHFKLVIADRGDPSYDSGIFLAAGSFDFGAIDLGDDLTVVDGNANCTGDPVTLDTGIVDASNATIEWYYEGNLLVELDADGNPILDEDGFEIPISTPTIEVTEPGEYAVAVVYFGACGLTDVINIEFFEAPELDLTIDSTFICGGGSGELDVDVLNEAQFNAVSYAWFLDGVEIVGETASTLVITEAGEYEVLVTSDGGCEATETIVIDSSNYDVSFDGIEIPCTPEGESNSFVLTPVVTGVPADELDNVEYLWSTNETTPSITITQDGSYTVTTTYNGCEATETFVASFRNTPSIDLGGDISTCDVGGVTIDATPAMGVGGVTFEWTYNGTSIPETGAIVNAVDYGFGTYTVEAYSDAACAASHSITISEADYTVNLSADQELVATVLNYCEGEESVPSYSITFTANIDGIDASLLSYAWYKNGSLISDAADEPTYTANYTEDVAAMDTYSVEVSLDSCVVNSEALGVDLTIAPYEGGCVISEGLSPGNLDGMNDCLDLSFLSDRTGIKNIQIFSRYGRVVYEKSNYVNDWCGQDKDGDVLQTATYFYVIEFTSPDPVYGKVKKGWIYLNRESNN
ncbi:choice-of-anchor L domain-containing protein [Mesonia sp.]|uniref:choice-of-anchor L domain-containing protein n=1 Tax=Mesonia sp. TaxID=1960830 RepID=UPI003F99CEC7